MLFPGKPGLTFGLCCLALIVGAAPIFTPYNSYVQNGTVLLSSILLSAVTLFAGLRLLPKGEESIWHKERRTVSAKESILVNKRRLLCD
jgi:hypothetical protein